MRFGLAVLILAAPLLSSCSSLGRRPAYAVAMGASAMTEDPRFQLYSQPSFALATVPAGLQVEDFWASVQTELRSDGHDIATEASGRVVRFIYVNEGKWWSYHFGVYRTPRATGTELRLVPLTAWHRSAKVGRPTEPVLASFASTQLPEVRRLLTEAAHNVVGT